MGRWWSFSRTQSSKGPQKKDMYLRMDEKVTRSPKGRLLSEFLKSKRNKKDIFFALFQQDNEHPLREGIVRLIEDRKQISFPPGEGVQIGKVRTSPKIFSGLFHHRSYPTSEITSSSTHFLSTIPFPFSHLFKSSLLSNLIDHYPHFLLKFSYLAKRLLTIILITLLPIT